ncbi:MAG: hypothetical protein AABZ06_02250 [Bdellovibrionota bacterium]
MITNKSRFGGFTILGAIALFAIVIMGALITAQLIKMFMGQEVSQDKRVLAEQVLVSTAAVLQAMSFDSVEAICKDANAIIEPNSPNKTCTDIGNTTFNAVTAATQIAQDAGLGIRRNWNGDRDAANGMICAEVTKCVFRASKHLLDVTLTAYSKPPGDYPTLKTQYSTFRKAR